MVRVLGALSLAIFFVACSAGKDSTTGVSTYDYVFDGVVDVNGQAVSEINGKAFHWRTHPVNVMIRPCQYSDGSTLSAVSGCSTAHVEAAKEGIDIWVNNASIFGEMSIAYAESDVDVEINWLHSFADVNASPNQIGVCVAAFSSDFTKLGTPLTIILSVTSGSSKTALTMSEIRALAAHEIGHCLGLFRHSPHEGDLMYPTLSATTSFTTRDVNTIRKLYSEPSAFGVGVALQATPGMRVSAPPFIIPNFE